MRTLFLAVSLFALEQTPAAAGDSHGGEPIRMVNGFPVVATFINSQGPYRMLIDTGAARCAVRRSVAQRAGLVPQREVLLATMVGEKMVSVASTAIRVGSLELPETEVLINDLPGLDRFESHVDGLLGQSFLAQRPYLIDYRARRLWLGDEAVAKAQRLGSPMQVEFSSGRPLLPVRVDFNATPFRLILDSGVNHLVLRCDNSCGTLIDEHTTQAVTNAGEMRVQKGRLPVAVVGSEKFFSVEAVLMRKSADPSNAEGSVPFEWFSAVYVDTALRLVRLAR